MARRNRRNFGAIRKLPSGKWQASYLAPDGSRRTAHMTFQAKLDADAFLSGVRYEMEKEIWVDPLEVPGGFHDEKHFQEFGVYALRHIGLQTSLLGEPLRPSTKSAYKRLLKNHLQSFAGESISSISKPAVDEWFMALLSSGKRTTASKAYKLLSAVLSRAVSDGLITKNPCAIKGAQSASSGKIVSFPTPEELMALASSINPRYREVVLVSAYAGLRFSEINELRVSDLTRTVSGGRATYEISVSRSAPLVDGKFFKGQPKSKASTRVVDVTSGLTPILDEVFARRSPFGADALLFPSANGKNLRGDVFAKAFGRAKDKSGISRTGLSHHSLRHFGGTYIAAAGGNLADVQAWLGDASAEAAMRYIHATGRSKALVEKMPSVTPRDLEQGDEALS